MNYSKPLVASFALCLIFAFSAEAQTVPVETGQFVHEFHRPGVATQTVYIMGHVGNAGIWIVEPDVDLVELLSASRMQGVGQQDPETRRTTRIRIYRNSPDGRELHYEATLDEIMRERARYPNLEENDVIEVETDRRRTISWRDVSSIIGTVSSLTVLIFRFIDL